MPTTAGHLANPDGIRLAYRDHTGSGTGPAGTLLLLHGLAGRMSEWDALLPALLANAHRVVMYDARGHGESTRRPADMSREAAVRDAVTVIRELGLKGEEGTEPLTLVGQSLGGHTAFLTAAAHPESLDALILVEAGPGAPNPGLPAEIAAWLDHWDHRDRATMLAAIAEPAEVSYHSQWAATTCPTLVVRGANGTMPADDAEAMPTARGPRAAATRLAVIDDAGHDVHLDQPHRLAATMTEFLNSLYRNES